MGVAAVIVGGIELWRPSSRPLQCDKETPQRWMNNGPFSWAIANGLVLGCGARSRLGFWIWYVVPVGAFLCGNAALGALAYGLYSLVRTAWVWPILLVIGPRLGFGESGHWFMSRFPLARSIGSTALIAIGAQLTFALGF